MYIPSGHQGMHSHSATSSPLDGANNGNVTAANQAATNRERESLLNVKTLLEEKLQQQTPPSSSGTSSLNLVLRNSDANEILSAINKALLLTSPQYLPHQQVPASLTGNSAVMAAATTAAIPTASNRRRSLESGGSATNPTRSPFSLQGQSLTQSAGLNGSDGGHSYGSLQNFSNGSNLIVLAGAKSPEDPFARVQPFNPIKPVSGGATSGRHQHQANLMYGSGNSATNNNNNNPGNSSCSGRRGRTQSVSFAGGQQGATADEDNDEISMRDDGGGNTGSLSLHPFATASPFAFGAPPEFESRFSGLPIASRAAASRDGPLALGSGGDHQGGAGGGGAGGGASLSPFDDNRSGSDGVTPPSAGGMRHHHHLQQQQQQQLQQQLSSGFGAQSNLSMSGGIGGGSNNSGNSAGGVRVDDLQLDLLNARRKSAVCGVAPHLSLASPRREADYILFMEEESKLLNECLAAVAALAPAEFGLITNQSVVPPLDVNEVEFDALSYCALLGRELAKQKSQSAATSGTGGSAERYTFIIVALHVLCKYRFMETFGANPERLARFLAELVDYYVYDDNYSGPTESISFTGPLRAAVNVHCLHLILSDSRLGSQLTDIEIAACIFACLAARVCNLGVSNEFLFRTNHPYARLFPGWSPQEQVSVTVVSELFRDFERTNPFDLAWWMSNEELGGAGSDGDGDGNGEAQSAPSDAGANASGATSPPPSDAARRGVVFTELVADLILTTDTRHQQWLFKECSEALRKAEGAATGRARRGSIMFGDHSIIRVADMHRILRCLVHLSEQYAYIFQSNFDSFKSWVGRWILETRSQGAAEQQQGVPVTFHCRDSTNSAAYHMQFMQVVVAPFAEMLSAVLPRAFMGSLFQNMQRLAQLHGELMLSCEQQQPQQQHQRKGDDVSLNIQLLSWLMNSDYQKAEKLRSLAVARLVAAPVRAVGGAGGAGAGGVRSTACEKFTQLIRNQVVRLENNGAGSSPPCLQQQQKHQQQRSTASSDSSANVDSALMQTVMRFIDNKLRVVENNRNSSGHNSESANRDILRTLEVDVVRLVRSAKPELLRPSIRNLPTDEEVVQALLDSNQTSLGSVFDNKSDALLALLLRVIRYTKKV